MDVSVDGSRTLTLESNPETVMEALREVSDRLSAEGLSILQVMLDGEAVSTETLYEAEGTRAVSDVANLAVETSETKVLVENSLAELQEVLPELPTACHELAKVFHSDAPETGFTQFQELADIWHSIKVRQLQICNASNLRLLELDVNGENLEALHLDLNQYLEEAAAALEKNDLVTLGDLLEYELAPRAEKESAIVAMLRARALA